MSTRSFRERFIETSDTQGQAALVSGNDDLSTAFAEIARRADISVNILTDRLEARIYGTKIAIEQLAAFSCRRGTKINILMKDNIADICSPGHPTVQLLHPLMDSGRAEVRTLEEQYTSGFDYTFVTGNHKSYFWLPEGDRSFGVASLSDFTTREKLHTLFNQLWQRAVPDTLPVIRQTQPQVPHGLTT